MRYRCFEIISTGKFCVQSADFYRSKNVDAFLDKQFIELLSEEAPELRSKTFDTIEEAIEWHNQEFSN
jgi:hypothetical protein